MFLLDTNVISELRKVTTGAANPRVSAWARSVDATEQYLSVMTIHELEFGISQVRRDKRKSLVLRVWLEDFILPAFRGRILNVDIPVARRCAQLHSVRTRAWSDALIAATAFTHGLTVVTRNTRHFIDTGVPVINPWEAA